jgi:osmotically inducible protein OsmC
MIRKARAVWQGSGKDGTGQLSSDSGVLSSTPYSFKTRFESEPGTNPEELIAAAHAGCFSMALTAALGRAGHTPTSIRTNAKVHLGAGEAGPTITQIDLEVEGDVPGIDQAAFQQFAEAAKTGCVVSRALAGVKTVTLNAKLV